MRDRRARRQLLGARPQPPAQASLVAPGCAAADAWRRRARPSPRTPSTRVLWRLYKASNFAFR